MQLLNGYDSAFLYVGMAAMLTVLLWAPYVVARMISWGIPAFLHNYPEGFPVDAGRQPLWAARAQRAHLNLVETLPAFIGVVLAAAISGADAAAVATGAAVFFWARVVHAVVYTLGVPYVRTPVYLVSWAAVLAIGFQALL